jgi:dipeptidyl aminopeptidase/acylaminoacyl peptidase
MFRKRAPLLVPPSSTPTFRQVTFRNTNIRTARFAPDGQTIVYAAQEGGRPPELFSTRIGSSERRSLGLQPAVVYSISSLGEMAIVKPAPPWAERPRFPASVAAGSSGRPDWWGGTLARVSLAGGAPREILEDVVGADWSPDGKSLAVMRYVEGKLRLEYPIGKVLYEFWPQRKPVVWVRVSKGGNRVLFVQDTARVVDLAGKVVDLKEEGHIDALWSPRGDEVWLPREREGATEIYGVTLAGRKRLVASLPGRFVLQDISRDERLLVENGRLQAQAYIHLQGEAQDRNLSIGDLSRLRDVSSDGKSILVDERGMGLSDRPPEVYVLKTDGTLPVRLGEGWPYAFSPDGKWALCYQHAREAEQFVLLPTGPGEPRTFSLGKIRPWWANFFPDGKRIVFASIGRPTRLYLLDLTEGKPRPISTNNVTLAIGSQSVSPDGKLVAGLDSDSGAQALYPVDGGEPRSIAGLAAAPAEVVIGWADDKMLYVHNSFDPSMKVWLLDITTGKRRLWKEIRPPDPFTAGDLDTLRVLPDRESYVHCYSRWLSDLFVVEGLK